MGTGLAHGLNRHGDVAYLDTPAGTVAANKAYDPFGQIAGTSGSGLPAAGFQGDYTDPDTDEVWMGARWYQPATAAFTARDTVFGELQTPISLNRYTYAHAKPRNMFDADGREPDFLRTPEAIKEHRAGRGPWQWPPTAAAREYVGGT